MQARTFIAGFFLALCIALPAPAQTLLDRAKRDEIFLTPGRDADVEEAHRKAKSTLKEFLAIVRAHRPSITFYAVKIPVRENGTTEFFWISKFSENGKKFTGALDNTPRLVGNVREGQIISFTERDIVDWLYKENGKTVGNFTACALIKKEPQAEADAFKKEFGLTCEP